MTTYLPQRTLTVGSRKNDLFVTRGLRYLLLFFSWREVSFIWSDVLYTKLHLAHTNCTLFCASNSQKGTASQQGKKTIFLDV